jgi:hypothetical protein
VHTETHYNATQLNDTQYYGIQHNETQTKEEAHQ